MWNIVDVQTSKRIRKESLSDFATQVLRDHPGFFEAEAQVVAQTLLRCFDFAACGSESVTEWIS